MFTRGLPTNSSFTYAKYFYSNFYYGCPTASADGATEEDKGCSPSDGATLGSIEGGAMFASNPGSALSADWATSSWRAPSTALARRASITHSAETCSATNCACGSKLSPSAWMESGLQPSAYPLQMAAKSGSRWCVATEVSTPDVP